MKEYEYSFKVDSLKPYIQFCEKGKYKCVLDCKQTRTIYTSNNGTIARITLNEGKDVKRVLDFKESKLSDDVLMEREESLPLVYTDQKAVDSILDMLGYKVGDTIVRTRKAYELDDVKFELDDYDIPCKVFVVAIEGNKDKVDNVYNTVKNYN